MAEFFEYVKRNKLVAILRNVPQDDMVRVADAVVRKGGIHLLEITFNQNREDAIDETTACIRKVKEYVMGDCLVGAGTVLTLEQLEAAYEAGAEFILSPNTNTAIIRRTRELGLGSVPGAMTPSEIVEAYQAGADIVKLFPAGDLPESYIKSVLAPINHVPLMGVGGVNENNIRRLEALGMMSFGLGSNIVDKTCVREKNWEEIGRRAGSFVKLLEQKG